MRNHRVARPELGLELRVQMLELGIPIRVPRPLPRLLVGRQTVAQRRQQLSHQPMAADG
jgi:hypothetical protein